MAIEDDNAALDVEPEAIPDEADYRDDDLARVFQEASPEHSPPEPIPDEPTPEPIPAPPPDEPDPRLAALEQQLQQLRSDSDQTRIQNDILRGQLLERTAPAPTVQTPVEDNEEALLTQLRDGIQKDPAVAILKAIKSLYKDNKGASDEAVERATKAAVAMVERKQGYDSDRATAIAEYGDLFNKNPDFGKLAAQIYERITADAPEIQPNVKWRQGAMYLAASTAYAQMARAGQLAITPNPKVVLMRERKATPTNPLLGSTDATNSPKVGDGIPGAELSKMRAAAARLRVPFDKYVETYKQMQKNDPGFGKG